MPRAIFVEEFEDECRRKYCASCDDCYGMICNVCWIMDMFKEIEAAKEVDAIERKHGKWVRKEIRGDIRTVCSNCREETGTMYEFNFCPNCGADMRGDSDV